MSSVVPFRHLAPLTPEQARADGFKCLSPVERAVAIEFAVTGHTLRQVAEDLQQPLATVKAVFGSPLVRAFIHDLQNEIAQHKIVNAAWVEQQVLKLWPQFTGEEEVNLVNKAGEQIEAKKFHAPEVASILKHFGGNKDQKAAGGISVVINFGDMGVQPQVNVIDGELSGLHRMGGMHDD